MAIESDNRDATFSEFSPVVITRCPLANEQDVKRAQSHVTGTSVKVPVLIHVSGLPAKAAGEVRRQTLWLNSQDCNSWRCYYKCDVDWSSCKVPVIIVRF